MRFVKGHGTENDFVILPDPDGVLDLTPEAVARLCDRRAGIGADGVLRVVRTKATEHEADAEWFMDYRNADGGVAEMCGNGIRVFARYLVDVDLAAPGEWDVATRAGLRRVTLGASGDVSVDMGLPELLGYGRRPWRGRRSRAGASRWGTRIWRAAWTSRSPRWTCPAPPASTRLRSPRA